MFDLIRRGRGEDFGVAQWLHDLSAAAGIIPDGRRLALYKRLTQLHLTPPTRPIARSAEEVFAVRGGDRLLRLSLRENQSDWHTFAEVFLRDAYRDPLAAAGAQIRTFVDVGAHIGLVSLLVKALHPSVQLLCVEPTAESANVLERNMAQNGCDYTLARKAISGHVGTVPLHATGWWSSCTIVPQVAEQRIAREGRPEHDLSLGPRQVETTTLDALFDAHGLDEVDVLKLDVEGAEAEVVFPGAKWLSRVRVLWLDLHDKYVDGPRVLSILEEAGYHCVPSLRPRSTVVLVRDATRFLYGEEARRRGVEVLLESTHGRSAAKSIS